MRLIPVAAWTAAGVLGIGALTGVAAAVSGSPGTGSVPAAAVADTAQATSDGDSVRDGARDGARQHHGRPGPVRRALRGLEHGEFVVRTADGHQTVHIQRGTITAVSATAMTVKSRDAFTETWTIGADTKIRRERKPATASALKVGDWVRVIGPKSGTGAAARRIGARTEAPPTLGSAGGSTTG